MDYNRNIRNTWIMVVAITALAFIASGIIELYAQVDLWHVISKLVTGSVLTLNGLSIRSKTKIIFRNPAPYFILFFLGYVLSLVGIITTFNVVLWALGVILLLCSIVLAYIKS